MCTNEWVYIVGFIWCSINTIAAIQQSKSYCWMENFVRGYKADEYKKMEKLCERLEKFEGDYGEQGDMKVLWRTLSNWEREFIRNWPKKREEIVKEVTNKVLGYGDIKNA